MEEKHFHLITDEDKILELKMNYHNEIVILLKGKELSNVHILNIERSNNLKKVNVLFIKMDDILKYSVFTDLSVKHLSFLPLISTYGCKPDSKDASASCKAPLTYRMMYLYCCIAIFAL